MGSTQAYKAVVGQSKRPQRVAGDGWVGRGGCSVGGSPGGNVWRYLFVGIDLLGSGAGVKCLVVVTGDWRYLSSGAWWHRSRVLLQHGQAPCMP